MNDELFNPKPEKEPRLGKDAMNDKPAAPKGGNRLSTIFLVVLAMHIIVIIGIVGFQLLRGKAKSDVAESTEATSTEVATKTTEGIPTEGQQATIDSGVNPTANVPSVASTQPTETANGAATIPGANEPVASWNSTPANTPVVEGQPSQPVLHPVAQAEPSKATVVRSGAAYTVVAGDTLTKIAKKNSVTVKQLREVNSLSSDALKIGQKLNLPDSGKAVASAPAKQDKKVATAPVAQASKGSSLYTVGKGDTLNKIARSFNTTAAKLADLNKIADPSKLKVGQKIKVPTQATASQNVNTSEASATEPSAQKPAQFRSAQNADLAMLREGERK